MAISDAAGGANSVDPASEVAAWIERLDHEPPRAVIDACESAVRHWYWDRKRIDAMRAIARAGIRRAIALANDAADPADAEHFRGAAKTMAYNLASFTWPGWDEEGVTLTADDVADGRDAARLNLRLAILLGRPDRVLADAHWLIGAHALVADDLPAAAEAFAEARTFAHAAGEADRTAMLGAYALLVASLAEPAGMAAFDAALATMRAGGAGAAYADQLLTARRVIARTRDGA